MVTHLSYEAPRAFILSLLEDESILQTSGTGTIEPGHDGGGVWNL